MHTRFLAFVRITCLILVAGTASVQPSFTQFDPWNRANDSKHLQPLASVVGLDGTVYLWTGYKGTCFFRSTNSGIDWEFVDVPDLLDIVDVVTHPNGSIYVATLKGLYVSSNRGDAWSRVNTGVDSIFRCLSIAPDGRIFVSTYNYLLWSSDLGGTWKRFDFRELYKTTGAVFGLSVAFRSTNEIYVSLATDPQYGGGGGVIWSTDGGLTWSKFVKNHLIPGWASSVAVNSRGYVFASFEHYLEWKCGAVRSIDAGNSWEDVPFLAKVEAINTLTLDDENNLLVGFKSTIYKSTDNGNTFFRPDTTMQWKPKKIRLAIDGSLYATGYNNTLCRSTNRGVSWDTVINIEKFINHVKPHSLAIRSISVHPRYLQGLIFAGTNEGLYRSFTHGEGFERLTNGFALDTVLCLKVRSNSHVFAGGIGGGFYSIDTGYTWSRVAIGDSTTTITAFLEGTGGILYAGSADSGVFRSDDTAVSWTRVTTSREGGNVTFLSIDARGTIFLGTDKGIFSSTDSGASWSDISSDIPTFFTRGCVVDSSGRIFVGTTDGMYVSRNSGLHWEHIGLRDTAVNALSIDRTGDVFVATDDGIYAARNEDPWQRLNRNLPEPGVLSVDCNPLGSVFIGTAHNGVFWNFKLQPFEVHQESDLRTLEAVCVVCRPNPAAAQAAITLTINRPGFVKADLVSLEGQIVQSIPAGGMEVGDHVLPVDVAALPPGLYFVRIATEQSVVHCRLMVVR